LSNAVSAGIHKVYSGADWTLDTGRWMLDFQLIELINSLYLQINI
jgi:hypothetical protein